MYIYTIFRKHRLLFYNIRRILLGKFSTDLYINPYTQDLTRIHLFHSQHKNIWFRYIWFKLFKKKTNIQLKMNCYVGYDFEQKTLIFKDNENNQDLTELFSGLNDFEIKINLRYKNLCLEELINSLTGKAMTYEELIELFALMLNTDLIFDGLQIDIDLSLVDQNDLLVLKLAL